MIPVLVAQGQRPAVPEDRGTLPGPDTGAFREGLEEYIALMRRCWSDMPQDRPGFQDVVRALVDLSGRFEHTENAPPMAPQGDTGDAMLPSCPVCFDNIPNIPNIPNIRLHPCGHAVCRDCSTSMLQRQMHSCPQCRKHVSERQDLFL